MVTWLNIDGGKNKVLFYLPILELKAKALIKVALVATLLVSR